MAAPYAEITEIDNTARIPAGNGIYGYIQIAAPIGPTSLKFIDSESALLNWFTANGKVEVGYDSAFYSALAYLKASNKLWVKRVVAQDALYGGCTVPVGTTVQAASLVNGLADPTAYTFPTSGSTTVAEQITVGTKADYNGSLSGTYFVLQGNQYFVWMNLTAKAEVAEVTCNADNLNSLAGAYFILPGQTKYAWFKVGTAGTDPGLTNTSLMGMTGIMVTFTASSTAAAMATALAAAITADADFTAEVSSTNTSVVIITRATAGAVEHGNAGNSGFNFITTAIGLNASSTVTVEGMTGVPVAYAANDTAATLATKIATAVTGITSSPFTATATDNIVTITSATAGRMANAYDSTSAPTSFNIKTVRQGSSQSGSVAFLLYFENPCAKAKDFTVKIFNYEDYPTKCPQEGTFVIELYRNSNLNTPIESYTCSRKENATNTSGNNIYIENVLEASQFIRALDNADVNEDEIPRSVPDGVSFGGGSDGSAVTTADKIRALQEIRSKELIEVSLLMDGGWTATAYKTALDAVASYRGDCVAITSLPYSLEDSASYIDQIRNYRNYEYNVNSSYTAIYSPHLNIYDYYNDRFIDVSPDGYIAAAISNADKNYKIWFPVLGFKRGTLSDVSDVKRKYTSGEMDTLYDMQVNPIRYIPRKGIVVWGQKTSQVQASALDRLNVRLLLISMKPSLQEFLESYIGELNTETNRANLKDRIDSYMKNIQANDGVYSFRCVCDKTNNTDETIANNQLLVDLYIRPTAAVEYVKLRIVLSPTDVSFE